MGLSHVVVTAVARDDLPDGGAAAFANTIEVIRAQSPPTIVAVSATHNDPCPEDPDV